jgi:hypothetical protein
MSAGAPPASGSPREWVSFEDPDEDRTWLFDVTFLASNWRCLFGTGCQGVLTAPAAERAEGCCSYGAHFTDDDDVARVRAAAEALREEQWQFARRGRRSGLVRVGPDGTRMTRLVEGACVFLNRPGFPAGAGCALHLAALDAGLPPSQLKPDVCWQLPLRREDHVEESGHVTSTVRQWERSDWGEGGREFAWWCTEAPEAFDGAEPVWEAMAEELVAMAGPEVYSRLVAYLDQRRRSRGLLAHPASRPPSAVELLAARTPTGRSARRPRESRGLR